MGRGLHLANRIQTGSHPDETGALAPTGAEQRHNPWRSVGSIARFGSCCESETYQTLVDRRRFRLTAPIGRLLADPERVRPADVQHRGPVLSMLVDRNGSVRLRCYRRFSVSDSGDGAQQVRFRGLPDD